MSEVTKDWQGSAWIAACISWCFGSSLSPLPKPTQRLSAFPAPACILRDTHRAAPEGITNVSSDKKASNSVIKIKVIRLSFYGLFLCRRLECSRQVGIHATTFIAQMSFSSNKTLKHFWCGRWKEPKLNALPLKTEKKNPHCGKKKFPRISMCERFSFEETMLL